MAMRLTVTYEVVTPESAAIGEAADRGYTMFESRTNIHEVMEWLERCHEASSTEIDAFTWAITEAQIDFRTGASTAYHVFLSGITVHQLRRLYRMAGLV